MKNNIEVVNVDAYTITIDLSYLYPDIENVLNFAKWGKKCKNPRTKKKILKSCLNQIKNLKPNPNLKS